MHERQSSQVLVLDTNTVAPCSVHETRKNKLNENKWKHREDLKRAIILRLNEIKVFWYILIVLWRCTRRFSILLRNWAWPKTSTLAWGALGTAAISGFLADLSWRTGRNMAQRGLRTLSTTEKLWVALISGFAWPGSLWMVRLGSQLAVSSRTLPLLSRWWGGNFPKCNSAGTIHSRLNYGK